MTWLSWNRVHNRVVVGGVFDGLPYRPDYCHEVDPSTDYNEYPACVEDGEWQIWFVGRLFTRTSTFYYDATTGNLLGNEFEFDETPASTIAVDLPNEFELLQSEHGMFQAMPFVQHARYAHALPAERVGEEHRRSRHRKLRRLDREMPLDQPIGHLIIPSAADAVHEAHDGSRRAELRGEASELLLASDQLRRARVVQAIAQRPGAHGVDHHRHTVLLRQHHLAQEVLHLAVEQNAPAAEDQQVEPADLRQNLAA